MLRRRFTRVRERTEIKTRRVISMVRSVKGGRLRVVTGKELVRDFVDMEDLSVTDALALSPNHIVVFNYLKATPGNPISLADSGTTFDRSNHAFIDPDMGQVTRGHNVDFGSGKSVISVDNYVILSNPSNRLFVYTTGGIQPETNKRIITDVIGFRTIDELNRWLDPPPPPPSSPPAPAPAPSVDDDQEYIYSDQEEDSGGSIRRRSSLPRRKVGRSSSSWKRRYTRRQRASRIGMGGYRSTRKSRKV